MKPRGRPKSTAAQRIYEDIERRILRLELLPGEEISEANIVKEFGVSRTPVREALLRLASEELVEVLPNQSARVVPLELEKTFEVLEAMELVQRAVNRWAALSRSDSALAEIREHHAAFKAAAMAHDLDNLVDANHRFHKSIGAACGNTILEDYYSDLLRRCLRLARTILGQNRWSRMGRDRYAHVIKEHEELVEAIAARDADAADANGKAHAQLFRGAVISYIDRKRADDIEIGDPVSQTNRS